MFFTVITGPFRRPLNCHNCAFLVIDNWDDWGKYRTMFTLIVVDESGVEQRIGSVKIGQQGLRAAGTIEPGQRAPELPDEFDMLGESFFSLGQGEDYYVTLNQLDPALQEKVLVSLRDCAFDLQIFDANYDEDVMQESLLRSVHESSVRHRLNRLTRGDAQLTEFKFRYRLAQPDGIQPAEMEFVVIPDSQPPTNVHVLIGRNGVGKTRCMRQLVKTLLGREPDGDELPAIIESADHFSDDVSFAGLALVSFSAFDDFDLRAQSSDLIGSHHIGLRHRVTIQGVEESRIKTPPELAADFRKSLERCRDGLKASRWRDAVKTLETDELFAEANVTALLDGAQDETWRGRSEELFKRLSSGHAIILLTVTRLVEVVDEKTLVLIDEPEGHLHPPLLSAFIRCLSDLLVKRNGVAIIATHSPVVLQEVPNSCAWKLRRSRSVSVAERPTIETFGENIGILTREVFGLEVTRSGFHQLLTNAVASGMNYEAIVARFDSKLGAEARSIVRALIAERGG